MAVLCEALSVIVPNRLLEARYEGGVDRYRSDTPNATFCTDGHLTRVGFMSPDDVEFFCARLEARSGMRLVGPRGLTDFAVVDQLGGPTTRCDWLAFGQHEGVACAWLVDREPGALATPAGWRQTQLRFMSDEEFAGLPIGAGARDRIRTTLDPKTGQVLYNGAAFEENLEFRDFLQAQQPVISGVLDELATRRKVGHWMWFIFPQLLGLGRSVRAMKYAIADLAQARRYVDHPVLGMRLRLCVEVVTNCGVSDPVAIFGGMDARKFRSCLTLFGRATADNAGFVTALNMFFDGAEDPLTLALLHGSK